MITRLLTAVFLLFLSIAASAQTAEVIVTVDTTKSGAKIEPEIYGQFAEQLGTGIYGGVWVGTDSKIPNIRGYRKDVVEALKHIHVPVIRWPGGCYADYYNWRDGIGPREQRPKRLDARRWLDPNTFGTHEYMDFVELLCAEAFISGNVGSLPPFELGQWVDYITSPLDDQLANERRKNGRKDPWRLKYLGIGNETWGCGGYMRPEYAADINARYSTFAITPKGVEMIKVASGGSAQGPDYMAFTEALMKGTVKLQALSFHYYAMPNGSKKGPAVGFDEDKWAAELALALKMEEYVTNVSAVMDKYDPDKKTALYVDEWGSWYDQEPGTKAGSHYQQNSLRDVEVAALTLNIFHRHTDRVKLAAIAQMVNVLQAMILTDNEKMLLTPTYHLFDMYQPFMGAVPYPVSVSGPEYRFGDIRMPMVDVSAARGANGRLYLSLTNTDPHKSAHVVTNVAGTGKGQILTGPTMDAHNTFEAPNTIKPVSFNALNAGGKLTVDLPAKSVVVLEVE